jgi:SynChlorMet cassette radical SAM/SPASM protein ScmF
MQDGVPLETLKNAVRTALPLGLTCVKLTGGEPLLYRSFSDLLMFLKQKGLAVYLETNGTLLDQPLLDRMASVGVDLVSVSLDGAAAKVHDAIRGVDNAFTRAFNGLKGLAVRGIEFQVILTLQRRNRHELPGLIRLCEETGAASLKINHLLPCGRARRAFDRGDNLDIDELLTLYRQVERNWARRGRLEIIFDLPVAFRSIADLKHRGINECQVLNILSILADGAYSLCGIGCSAAELRMGNVHEDDLALVWRGHPVLTELRRSLPAKLEPPCRDCIFRYQCLGSCRANAFALTRNLYAAYFLCSEYRAQGRFPSSRCACATVAP